MGKVEEETYICICHKHGEYVLQGQPLLGANDSDVGQPVQELPSCPKCKEIHKKDLCTECEQHSASVDFSEGVIASIHGMIERICKCCYLKRVKEGLQSATETATKLEAELAEVPCVAP
jgi:hypothetical protein